MIRLENLQNIAPETIQQLANNKKIADYLRDVFPHPYSIQDAMLFLQLATEGVLGHTFAICDDDVFVGVGSIVPQTDVYRNNAEIGYWLGEPYWGQGYATQAVKLLVNYAFQELNLTRVYAGVFTGNQASMRVLEKAGFKQEAILKKSIAKRNQLLDEHLFSILRS